MIEAYPLRWPDGWKRTPPTKRLNGAFKTYGAKLTIAVACGRVLHELNLFSTPCKDVIISTNVRTRMDGRPRSDQRAPEDPGAAVYWKEHTITRCMAIDRYTTVADNLGAIAATLEAMRAIERHGGAEILERAFTGFLALPEKASEPWRKVLGIPSAARASLDVIEGRFRELALKHHPDHGGSPEQFHRLVLARDAAKAEVRG